MKRRGTPTFARHEPVDLDLEGGLTRGRVLRTRGWTVRATNVPVNMSVCVHELVLVWVVGETRPRWVDSARVQRRAA